MAYVQRDSEGKINGVFANPQKGYAEEELSDDSPEVVSHSNPAQTRKTLVEQLIASPKDLSDLKAALAK